MSGRNRLSWVLDHVEQIAIGCLAAVILMLSFSNVVLRYGFHAPLSWSDEVVRFGLVWIVFLASSIAVKKQMHIRLEGVVEHLPEVGRTAVFYLVSALVAGLFVFLIIYGGLLAWEAREITSTALGWSLLYLNAAVPVGSLLMLIRQVQGLCSGFSRNGPSALTNKEPL